jgi:hypothetical protein
MPPQNQPSNKQTKGAASTATSSPAQPAPKPSAVDTGGVDLSKLTPEQLKAIQKQLKEARKETTGKKDERFLIIDTMLKEKDEDGGGFRHTTREIANKLAENNLVDKTDPDWAKNEIKKIQARKQFLEKSRDKAGALVHPEGTFGYKASGGFGLTSVGVTAWFNNAENVAKLSPADKAVIAKSLK